MVFEYNNTFQKFVCSKYVFTTTELKYPFCWMYNQVRNLNIRIYNYYVNLSNDIRKTSSDQE